MENTNRNKKELLQDLFEEWEKEHIKANHENFIADGIIDLSEWEAQITPKVCFLLKEAYGERFDLAEKMRKEGAFNDTWFNGAIWTQAIHDAFTKPLGNIIPYNEEKYKAIKAQSHEIIRKIAVVNIKKSDGENRSKNDDLREYVKMDADKIRKEIDIIHPDIILCGNIWELVEAKVFEDFEESKEIPEVYIGKDMVVINHYHPAYFAIKDEFHYYTLREICRAIRQKYTTIFAKWQQIDNLQLK